MTAIASAAGLAIARSPRHCTARPSAAASPASVGPIGAANALASVGFAAGHVVMRDSMAVALVFLPSLVLGWLYERTGRLGPVMGVHAVYNLAWLTLLCPG